MAATEAKKSDPIAISTAFIERINAGDVAGLNALMTEDHIFQDALGGRFVGRETVCEGWKHYFAMVGNYKIYVQDYFVKEETVAMFGTASGSYPVGASGSDGFWEVPAAWRAVVRGGLVAEWYVYADNQPLRKLMGERVP